MGTIIVYGIATEEGNEISNGHQSIGEARRLAQALANDKGRTLYVCEVKVDGATGEMEWEEGGEAVEPEDADA